jgi:hypothetical protein
MLTSTEAIIVGVIVVLLGGIVWIGIDGSRRDQEEWDRFSVAHQCKVVGRIKGQTQTVITSGVNGQMQVGVVGGKRQTSYLCNDGVTYTR